MKPSEARSARGSSEPDYPALIQEDHIQDRPLSKEIGAPRGYRRLDGLDYLRKKHGIARHQIEAGRRLQADYEQSQMQAGARSSNSIINNSGPRAHGIPDAALDAKKRVDEALATIPPELVSMTILFLLPDFREQPFNIEKIAERVREDKRSIALGVRASLSLLARHYGG